MQIVFYASSFLQLVAAAVKFETISDPCSGRCSSLVQTLLTRLEMTLTPA
jgi:hypothetical protein